LGNHVEQAGSLVAPNRLRFDFSHFSSVTEDAMKKIEQLVNEKIWASLPLEIDHKSFTAATELGATALFGASYRDVVRGVEIANDRPEVSGVCELDHT